MTNNPDLTHEDLDRKEAHLLQMMQTVAGTRTTGAYAATRLSVGHRFLEIDRMRALLLQRAK